MTNLIPRPATSHAANQTIITHEVETPKGSIPHSYFSFDSEDDLVLDFLASIR